MKQIVTLLLLIVSFGSYGQTTLPASSKIVGNQIYQSPAGGLYIYKGSAYAPNAYFPLAKLADISATSPIFYNSGTGVISSQPASATQDGYVNQIAQTWAGAKTFTDNMYISGSSSKLLSIYSASGASSIILDRYPVSKGSIDLKTSGVSKWSFGFEESSNSFLIKNDSTLTGALKIDLASNAVLVGYTSRPDPNTLFAVNGRSWLNGYTYIAGQLYVTQEASFGYPGGNSMVQIMSGANPYVVVHGGVGENVTFNVMRQPSGVRWLGGFYGSVGADNFKIHNYQLGTHALEADVANNNITLTGALVGKTALFSGATLELANPSASSQFVATRATPSSGLVNTVYRTTSVAESWSVGMEISSSNFAIIGAVKAIDITRSNGNIALLGALTGTSAKFGTGSDVGRVTIHQSSDASTGGLTVHDSGGNNSVRLWSDATNAYVYSNNANSPLVIGATTLTVPALTGTSATFSLGGYFTGFTAPASGNSVEIGYTGGTGIINSFNRTGTTFLPLQFAASSYNFTQGSITGTQAFFATSASRVIQLNEYASGVPSIRFVNDTQAQLRSGSIDGNEVIFNIGASSGLTVTERGRFTTSGYLKVSNDGTYNNVSDTYHELRSSIASWALVVTNSNATPNGIFVKHTTATPNSTDSPFLRGDDASAMRVELRSNGGIANYSANNVNLSDRRTKTGIEKAGSFWEVIKAIEFDKYKYISQNPNDKRKLLGVMADQVEGVYSDWVNNEGSFGKALDGTNFKSVYEQQLQYGVNIVVQESMKRIEALEAEVLILKSK